jgi:hypothetical protein
MSEKRIEAGKNMVVRQRNYRRVRDRALARLANAYPDDYKKLLELEKANDEQQGKSWLDINGATRAAQLDIRSATVSTSTREASNGGENESDRGGKA